MATSASVLLRNCSHATDNNGCTPVNSAAGNGYLEVVKFLVEDACVGFIR